MTYEDVLFILEKESYSPNSGEVVRIAIEAIEKQIPKKPVEYKGNPDNIFVCAKCGSTFIKGKYNKRTYCPNCGQMQLWEEE